MSIAHIVRRYLHEILEIIEEESGHRRKHHHHARRLRFTLKWAGITITGENMTFTLAPGQSVPVSVSPVDAAGNPSKANLSGVSITTADATIFTVAADPSDPNGAIVTAVAEGSATITATATATEPDGTTTEQIQGVATIIVTAAPPAPAAALVFTFGTPTP